MAFTGSHFLDLHTYIPTEIVNVMISKLSDTRENEAMLLILVFCEISNRYFFRMHVVGASTIAVPRLEVDRFRGTSVPMTRDLE